MTADIVKLRPSDDPDEVLRAAVGEVKDVLIIGYDSDGELYVASSPYFADGGNMLWALETVKAKLMNMDWSE